MGLFDSLFSNPSDQALWALGSGLLGVRRGNEGKAFMGAMDTYNQAQEMQRRGKMSDAQMQMIQMQLAEHKQKMDDAAIERAWLSDPKNTMNPARPEVPWGTGMTGNLDEQDINPGVQALPAMPKSPRQLGMAMMASGSFPLMKAGMGMVQKAAPIHFKEGEQLRDSEDPTKLIASNPKQPELTPDYRNYLIAQAQGYKGTFEHFLVQMKQAGPSAMGTTFQIVPGVVNGQPQYVSIPTRGGGANTPIPTGIQTEKSVAKPMPPAAMKIETDLINQIATTAGMNQQLGNVVKQIDTGELILNPAANLIGSIRNATGSSDPNSRNLASFKSNLEKMRNDSLRLNSGTQTEGDAQRAWNELVSNINDAKLVRQRLDEIMAMNKRAAMAKRAQIEQNRQLYGVDQMDDEQFNKVTGQQPGPTAPAPSSSASPPRAGDIVGDFRFKGGDPAKQENWEKIR